MGRPRVAIVHDWFVGGGAERVVAELHKIYPDAPIYTSYCSDEWRAKLDGKVITGFLQNWPFGRLRKFVPYLRIWWFSRLDLSDFDLVISSSGAEAKGIYTTQKKPAWVRFMNSAAAQGDGEDRKGAVHDSTATADQSRQQSDTAERLGSVGGSADKQAGPIHISYCHAPTHYYWSRYEQYLAHPGFGFFDPLARLGLRLLVGPLRRWDYRAAQRPDYMIANSNFIKDEIKKYYGRDAIVIHPPVDIDRFAGKAGEPRCGFITAGRQTPYKRFDLAVRACSELNLPLIIVGHGPDHRRLKKIAGKSVTFMRADDEKLVRLFKTSQAFIFPGIDDFGIVAVEALAAGTPVIAFGRGGALDYIDKETGLLFKDQTVKSLSDALSSFRPELYDHDKIARAAAEFAPQVFRRKFSDFIKSL